MTITKYPEYDINEWRSYPLPTIGRTPYCDVKLIPANQEFTEYCTNLSTHSFISEGYGRKIFLCDTHKHLRPVTRGGIIIEGESE